MQQNKKTFCTAPWFHVRLSIEGDFTPCCSFEIDRSNYQWQKFYNYPNNQLSDWLDSDYLKYIKKELEQGHRIEECRKCWSDEDNGHSSLRMRMNEISTNQKSIDQSWIPGYFKHKTDYKNDILQYVDLNLNHLCNFECAMCNPADSSRIYNKWSRDKEQFFVKDIIAKTPSYFDTIREKYKAGVNYTMLKQVLERKPKMIKLIGGEPLMDESLLEILQNSPADLTKNTSLLFITNGSKSLKQVAQRLSHFKEVRFCISLEGVSLVQDYVRKGSVWEEIESNIDEYIEENTSHLLSVAHCVQALTIYHFQDLLNWANAKRIPILFNTVYNPDYMSLAAIPDTLKTEVIERLHNTINQDKQSTQNNISLGGIVKNLLDVEYNPELTTKLKKYIQWYDPNQTFKEILPEWLPYL
jgi:molybdenum cofactor biosynthesis enzyme MoaA